MPFFQRESAMKKWRFRVNWKVQVVLLSVLILWLVVPVGAYNHSIKFFLGLWVYVGIFLYLKRRYRNKSGVLIATLLALPVVIVYGLIYLFVVNSYLTLPSSFAPLVGIAFGLAIFRFNKITKTLVSFLLLCVTLWVVLYGYDYWKHKVAFGTFTGKVEKEVSPEFYFVDSRNRIIDGESFGNKMVIFDFWTTSCAICIKKFPLLESYYVKHLNNPNVEIFAVNIPIKRDTIGEAESIIRNRGFTFPLLFTPNDSLYKSFGVIVVPTVVVIGADKKIIYRGELEGIKRLGL